MENHPLEKERHVLQGFVLFASLSKKFPAETMQSLARPSMVTQRETPSGEKRLPAALAWNDGTAPHVPHPNSKEQAHRG
jgi:hypothetical protein